VKNEVGWRLSEANSWATVQSRKGGGGFGSVHVVDGWARGLTVLSCNKEETPGWAACGLSTRFDRSS
jgi:hypothetical protein